MKNFTLAVIIGINLFCIQFKLEAQVDVNDSLALVDLFKSTDGHHWKNHKNWLTIKPVSTWYGISLSGNRIFTLELPDNNLSGTLPASLGNLILLEALELNNNNLTGNIPVELGNLKSMQFLVLDHNQLSGNIPASFGKLAVQYLYLNDNLLSGNIPDELGNAKKLEWLSLQNNQLSGTMPASLGDKITLLEYIDLSNNKLSGNLPAGLKNINLYYLYLNNNQFTGSIPLWDSLTSLRELNLSHNQLTGHIPNNFPRHWLMAVLNLSYNQLRGSIPKNFSQLHYLDRLNLANNFFQDTVPSFLTRVKVLEIQNNHFTFDGLESLPKSEFNRFKYSPQKKVDVHQNANILSVYAGGTLSNNTYKWFKNGTLIITKKGDSTFTPITNGSYTVQITNDIATDLTLESNKIVFNVTTTLQQNNFAANTNDKVYFSVYPNPATTTANIVSNTTGNYTIQLTDVTGNILQTKTIVANKKNNVQLNISGYSSGLYFILVTDENKHTETLKLNKQ